MTHITCKFNPTAVINVKVAEYGVDINCLLVFKSDLKA